MSLILLWLGAAPPYRPYSLRAAYSVATLNNFQNDTYCSCRFSISKYNTYYERNLKKLYREILDTMSYDEVLELVKARFRNLDKIHVLKLSVIFLDLVLFVIALFFIYIGFTEWIDFKYVFFSV